MGRLIKCSAGLLSMVTIAVPAIGFLNARAQNSKEFEKRTTLDGRVTDAMCGASHMIKGDGAKCVQACVKGGSHYALLAGSDVYALVGHDEELVKLADEVVTVSGTIENGDTILIASLQSASSASKSVTPPPSGNSPEPPPTTIKGLVRDLACPIQNKAATARTFNLKCALECVRAGSTIVIQSDDGILYLPISSSMPDEDQRSRLAPFVGKYVEIHGQMFERQGAHAIAIQDIRQLKEIPLRTEAD